MNRTFFKNIRREIWETKARFISIMMIIALGVGFLSGVKSTSPSMINMAENYYSENRLMDFSLISPVGFDEEDINSVAENEYVTDVMPSYSCDVFTPLDEGDAVVRISSLPYSYKDNYALNTLDVVEGRLPKNEKEIVLDADTLKDISVGDTLKIKKKSGDTEATDYLKSLSYKVVGKVRSPLFISFERGNTTIGDGKLKSFAFVKDSCFKPEKYTSLYVKTKASDEGTSPFDNSYDNKIKDEKESLTKVGEDRISHFVKEQQDSLDKKVAKFEKEKKTALNKLKEQETSLAESEEQLKTAQQTYLMAGMDDSALKPQIEQLEKAKKSLDKAKDKTNAKLKKTEDKLSDAQKTIDEFKGEGWYINTRDDNLGYSGFEENTQRVDNVAAVFPVFFLLVAILVCVTTMTRLIDEKRTEIGILKALGYNNGSIVVKYLIYAGSSGVLGCILGMAIGLPILPRVIYYAYKMMYHMPDITIVPDWGATILSICAAILCTVLVAVFTCQKTLREKSFQLMRPKAPKPGNRILLEKIPAIWKHFGFTSKVTARNLFRYKARFMMTVLGVAGCTALVLAAFYLHDSITGVVDTQYGEIYHYDAMMAVKEDKTKSQLTDLTSEIQGDSDIEDYMLYYNKSVSAKTDDSSVTSSLYLTVPENNEKFLEMVSLHNRKTGEKYSLRDDGVIITDKLSSLLNLKEGDTFTLDYNNERVDVKVSGITEHYLFNSIYMSQKLYNELYGENAKYNMIMAKIPNLTDKMERDIGNRYLENNDVAAVSFCSEFMNNFNKTIRSLDIVVLVMIICAGLLALVVLYNLTNINIAERKREIATLKVLGFYNKETSAYIYRENIVLTILGIIFGLILGIFLGYFIIITVEIENVMFGRSIRLLSFIWAILLTGVFSLMVNFLMHFKMKKIDMIESLKSIE
ncbi:MAG: FtsX-like permease family protein [Ruminococcus sp.]